MGGGGILKLADESLELLLKRHLSLGLGSELGVAGSEERDLAGPVLVPEDVKDGGEASISGVDAVAHEILGGEESKVGVRSRDGRIGGLEGAEEVDRRVEAGRGRVVLGAETVDVIKLEEDHLLILAGRVSAAVGEELVAKTLARARELKVDDIVAKLDDLDTGVRSEDGVEEDLGVLDRVGNDLGDGGAIKQFAVAQKVNKKIFTTEKKGRT